jgi:hypothetical protein
MILDLEYVHYNNQFVVIVSHHGPESIWEIPLINYIDPLDWINDDVRRDELTNLFLSIPMLLHI